ncbi:MAG: MMPL family transporter [Bacillota bacterium]|nr:MMPL family transporter [Bacillota bacterium]
MSILEKLHRKRQDAERSGNDGKDAPKKNALAYFIVDHNHVISKIVAVFVIFFLICIPFVGINYDLTSYLPESSESKQAIDKMEATFGYPGTARIMIKDVTLYEAKQYKSLMEKVDGVDQIVWCDMTTPIYSSPDFIDYTKIDEYYKDGNAVMDLTFKKGDNDDSTKQAINRLTEILGDRGYVTGPSPTQKLISENVQQQMKFILLFAGAVIFLILLFTTTSWFQPILFLTVMLCAIILNKGSNIILGEISFVTNNIQDVMQLATSMDYSVFLLNAYERERARGLDNETALKIGLGNTINTVLASSMTTFFGFLALVTMKFHMGFDLGIVLAKSIICSLLMVIFLMPALLLKWNDRLDRTEHKPFLPDFHKFSIRVNRFSPYILAALLIFALPAYFAQSMNDFKFGVSALASGKRTAIYQETREIEEKFGKSNLFVCIFPNDSPATEKAIIDEIEAMPDCKKVMGIASYLPDGVPEQILPGKITELFHKDGWTRILVYLKTKEESELAFKDSNEVQSVIRKYYPEEGFVAGMTPTNIDLKQILSEDYTNANNLAIFCIFLVVAITYKSLVIPIVTMIPIMIAIYMNMSFPYIAGEEMIYIAYAVVSCIQLGSCIDYAISSMENYELIRKTEPDKKIAAQKMTQMSFPSILTSGMILSLCGYSINQLSSIPVISEVGHLVGRGAFFAVIAVTCAMPVLLKLFDIFLTADARTRHRIMREKAMQFGARFHGKERK